MTPPASLTPPHRSSPWSTEDVVRWLPWVAAAAAVCAIAWYQASGEAHLRSQVAWANFSVLGVTLLFYCNVVLLLRGRRAVMERRRRLLAAVPTLPVAKADASEEVLVAPVSGTRYHLPGCPLGAQRQLSAATRSEHEAAGRLPCGICEP